MAGVDADAVSAQSSAQAEVVASAASIDDVAAVQAASFVVTESDGVVSFSGTATGAVMMTLNAAGGATFTRAGVEGKDGDTSSASVVTIDNVASKSIAGSVALNVVISGAATAGDDGFVIDAPAATSLKLSGNTGAGSDAITVKIADLNVGSADVRTVTIDTSDLTVSSSDSIIFDFEGAEDLVILDAASDLSQFDTVEVAKGTADLRSITLKDGVDLIVNSGVAVTVTQLNSLESLSSVTGLGELTIVVESEADLANVDISGLQTIGFGSGEEGFVKVRLSDGATVSQGTEVTSTEAVDLISSIQAASTICQH